MLDFLARLFSLLAPYNSNYYQKFMADNNNFWRKKKSFFPPIFPLCELQRSTLGIGRWTTMTITKPKLDPGSHMSTPQRGLRLSRIRFFVGFSLGKEPHVSFMYFTQTLPPQKHCTLGLNSEWLNGKLTDFVERLVVPLIIKADLWIVWWSINSERKVKLIYVYSSVFLSVQNSS